MREGWQEYKKFPFLFASQMTDGRADGSVAPGVRGGEVLLFNFILEGRAGQNVSSEIYRRAFL